MQKRSSLVILLAAMALAVLIYTFRAMTNEANDFISIFVSNIRSMTWSGQFNLDFACYLLLSGIWIMWRGRYTTISVLVAIAAMVLGIVFFAPYLIYLIIGSKGDMKKVMLGNAA